MIIDNKELLELVEQEAASDERLTDAKKEVAELTERMAEIQLENKEELELNRNLRIKINEIAVPLILDKKGEFDTFTRPRLEDGKVVVDIENNLPRTLEEAERNIKERILEIDNGWRSHLTQDTK